MTTERQAYFVHCDQIPPQSFLRPPSRLELDRELARERQREEVPGTVQTQQLRDRV